MSNVKVAAFAVSLDGFAAGPDQSIDDPLGRGGPDLMKWFFKTRTFQAMHGGEGGVVDVDDEYARRSFDNVGAWIMGRNMFGPVRGPWPNEDWTGWWGDEPPYHVPVFVLTHHARADLKMKGRTTFHFVTDGPAAALDRARRAAGGKDVRIGGGVQTVRSYLRAGAIDEMHLVYGPLFLGSGESLLAGVDLPALGFGVTESGATEHATHVILGRGPSRAT